MSLGEGSVPSPRRWLLLFLLTAGMFFCYAHRGALSVAAPFLMRELHLGAGMMGILLSAFFWSYSLAQVPAGWLVDRFGLGRAYAAGFFIWTTATALTGMVASVSALLAIRIVVGFGQGVPFPASARAVADWFPQGERGGATGAYLSGNRLGQAAISAAGAAVIAAWGWRTLFLLAGAAGLLWLVAWLATIRFWDGAPLMAGRTEVTRDSIPIREAWPLLRNRRMAGVFLGYFAYDYVWFLFLTWMPGYLAMERKFGPRDMAVYSSVPFVVVSFVVVLSGVLSDALVRSGYREITARKLLISCGLLIACLIAPAAFVQDKTLSVWLLGASICGLGITAPNSWALTQAVCPKHLLATASGIQNLGGNLGGVVAPMLTGFLAAATGSFGAGFLLAAFILLAGIAAYWFLIPENVPDPAPNPLPVGIR